jgi:peptidoglycan biosynthesis protein MviN/MurJ (putative lipid II flippase)
MRQADSGQTIQTKIRKASSILVISILLSRVVGFFREWVLAHSVGANSMTDVYYASFTIPDFLNYLIVFVYYQYHNFVKTY